MCDIYEAKCEEPRCRVIVPMHLGEFHTKRSEVAVRCWKHLNAWKDQPHVKLYLCRSGVFAPNDRKRRRVAVKMLTANAIVHEWENHPNVRI